jgi:hypothetical protein
MTTTILGLDLLLQESCIDLRLASRLVLSDVGATIQVLRLIGNQYEFTLDRPKRMEECLASLDVNMWFDAVCSRTFACDDQHIATTALWKHCRLVAQHSQFIAESLEGVSPENAYLVGLLHESQFIPAVMALDRCERDLISSASTCSMDGSLPLFVLAALRSVKGAHPRSTWKFILTKAHELIGAKIDFDAVVLDVINMPGVMEYMQ